ncbi:MAG: DUF3109 family protein [Ignavibacteriae bacterium]|nr:DUF3109 family protein [Ignavibacteriota bacterium]
MNVKQYIISDEFFERGFSPNGGPCNCTSVCCEGGVYTDVQEREKILAHRNVVKKYMDITQTADETQWFEANEHEDPDFPSGKCIGTREINDKCAFLDKHGRCSLQVAAVEEGMHKWALKPLFCILYPVEIADSVVGFDDMLQDEEHCCSIRSDFDQPLFRACREELTHLLGKDGFAELEAHYATIQNLRHIQEPTER